MKNTVLYESVEDIEIKCHYKGNYMMPCTHWHDVYEIYVLEAGYRECMINTNTFIKLESRDVVLVKPGKQHCFLAGEYVSSGFHFSKEFMRRYFTDVFIERITKCFDKEVMRVRGTDFNTLTTLIENLYENNDDSVSFVQLLILLENNMDRETKYNKKENNVLYNIVDYINNNYKCIQNLDEIANKFHMSKYHLCRVFKNAVGNSIKQYINALKVQRACEMLEDDTIPISVIVTECGFNNSTYFGRVFKMIVGQTPSEYRKYNRVKYRSE